MLLPIYQNTVYGLLAVWCMTIYLLLYSSLYSLYASLQLAQHFAVNGLCCLSFASHASCLPCIAHIYVHVYMYHTYMYMFVCLYAYIINLWLLMCFSCIMSSLNYIYVRIQRDLRMHVKRPTNACKETTSASG
jgi:hypothetical protein